MKRKPNTPVATAELRRRAEARLRNQRNGQRSEAGVPKSDAGPPRLLHELQVHQIELEMQNAELQKVRDDLEVTLEKYTDLYDFAPVGYFTLAADGTIQLVNLTGASLLRIERSRLVGRSFGLLVVAELRPAFSAFLKQVFAGQPKQSSDFELLSQSGQPARIVNLEAQRLLNGQECRAVMVDITKRKQAEATQRRLDVLGASNLKLRREIIRRQAVEESLKQSEQHQSRLLEQSRQMQEQLRQLSRQVLQAQEEERKRISRELHDVIAQTLTGINIRLATLKKEAGRNTDGFDGKIARTQLLVGKSVDIVHRFARELRPAVLDDLGLIPALHSFMIDFAARTGVHTCLTAFARVEKMDIAKRTVLFRVAQEALTNVARHAHASRVEVKLQKLPDGICMQIKDDGKSFQVQPALLVGGSKRLGLLGMRERVEMVGGAFGVESAPGQGTTIQVEIPFAKVRKGPLKKSGETTLECP